MNGPNKLFSAGEHCLTEDQLLLYMQSKLSPSEQHYVEKHLLGCELCTDALEGLRLSKSPEKLTEIIAGLNQQIDNRVKPVEKKIIPLYPWLRIAAIIVLIAVGAGTFLYLQKEQKQQEKIVAEKKADIPPTLPQNNFELKSAEPVSTEQPKEIAAKEFKTPLVTEQKSKTRGAGDEIKSNDVSTTTIAAVTEEKEAREDSPQAEYKQPLPEAVKDLSKQEAVNESAGTAKKSIESTVKSEVTYREKANSDFNTQSSNSAIIIDNAKFQIKNSQYDSANLLLDQVINNNDTNFMEEAMWNKSIALENLNRKTDAKNILQKIVTMNGKYKKKAKEKLKTW